MYVHVTERGRGSSWPCLVCRDHNMLMHAAWSLLDVFTQRLEQFPPGVVCPAEGWCASSSTDVRDWPDEWSWVLWLAEADGTLAGLHGRVLCGHATCREQLISSSPRLISVMTNYSSTMLHAKRQAGDGNILTQNDWPENTKFIMMYCVSWGFLFLVIW